MKQLSKITLFGAMLCALAFASCKKDLDFTSDTFFGVKAVTQSANCNADCGETADCEGKTVKIKGTLDELNINESDNQFYLIDEDKDKFTMEIKVDEAVNAAVFQKLNGNGGTVFKVEGVLSGFDASTNANCERIFFVSVTDAAKVEQE